MRKSYLLIPVLSALLACNLSGMIPATQAPTEAQPVPQGTSAASGQATPTLMATSASQDTGFPALERHAAALRPGFDAVLTAYEHGPRYLVSLDLQPTEGHISIRGEQRVLYHNNTGELLDEIVFRLTANAIGAPDTLVIESLEAPGLRGEPVFSQRNSVMRLPLAEPLPPGSSIPIEMRFTLYLPAGAEYNYGRMAYLAETLVLSSGLPLLSVYGPDGWWDGPLQGPGDPAYSETALFDLSIRAPDSLRLAITGTVIEQSTEGGLTRYEVVTGPVRDVSLAAGPRLVETSAEANGVTVRAWSAGREDADQHAIGLGAQTVAVFDEEFGPYPYRELDIVAANITAAGIEYPGLIYIAADIWDINVDFFDIVIIHEIGHQWWYGLVGNNQVTEPWLDEGLTEYAVQVFYRETAGPAAAAEVRAAYQSELDWYLDVQKEGVPLGLPAVAYQNSEYRIFVYSAGALFFAELEDRYGTEAMRAFLRGYFDSQQYGVISNAELRDLLVAEFGGEAGDFFDQWVIAGEF